MQPFDVGVARDRRAAAPAPIASPTAGPDAPDSRWACRSRRARRRPGSTACRSASTRINASTQPPMTLSPSASSSARRRTTCPATNSTIWKGRPAPNRRRSSATVRATGTGVSCSAATTLYSRAMSCADGVSPCSGGRRSTHLDAVVEDHGTSDWSGRRRSARARNSPSRADAGANADSGPARPGRARRAVS